MDLKIANKIALITGSTKGIGFASAKKLASEGASVIINGRNKKNVEDAILRIQNEVKNANVLGIVADLGTKEGCDKLIQEVLHIDILINNLGIFEPKEFTKITDDDWLTMFTTNVMSGFRLSRHYFPLLLEQNWGRSIFITS